MSIPAKAPIAQEGAMPAQQGLSPLSQMPPEVQASPKQGAMPAQPEEDAVQSIIGSHTQELIGEEETSELNSWLDEEITIPAMHNQPAVKTTRRESLKTGAQAAAILGAGAAVVAILSSAALAPVMKIASQELIKGAAKLAGAKYPAAALKGTFIIKPHLVAGGALKLLAKAVFSRTGLGTGFLISAGFTSSRVMGSIAIADMKDQPGYVEKGMKSHTDAITDFEWNVQNFQKAKRISKKLSKIPVVGAFTKAIGVMSYFETEERNIPAYRLSIDMAAEAQRVTQARERFGE